MKAIRAERYWQPMVLKQIRNIIELTTYWLKAMVGLGKTAEVPVSVPAAKTTVSTALGEGIQISREPNNNSKLFVLFGIQPSWDIDQIADQLRELKGSFGSSKVIVCSELYMDELVHRCEEFEYDAYLLTCDGREEFSKALSNVQSGKMYLSRSVITSYCITRRREWES